MLYRLYLLALDMDLHRTRIRDRLPFGPPKSVRDEVREMGERMWVNASMGARA